MRNGIGKRFLGIYELKGVKSKTEFGRMFGVSKSTAEHWFSSQIEPSPKNIIKMFTLFPDINKNWLLFGEEPILLNQPKKLSTAETKLEMLERENEILRKHIKALENIIVLLKEKH